MHLSCRFCNDVALLVIFVSLFIRRALLNGQDCNYGIAIMLSKFKEFRDFKLFLIFAVLELRLAQH